MNLNFKFSDTKPIQNGTFIGMKENGKSFLFRTIGECETLTGIVFSSSHEYYKIPILLDDETTTFLR